MTLYFEIIHRTVNLIITFIMSCEVNEALDEPQTNIHAHVWKQGSLFYMYIIYIDTI